MRRQDYTHNQAQKNLLELKNEYIQLKIEATTEEVFKTN